MLADDEFFSVLGDVGTPVSSTRQRWMRRCAGSRRRRRPWTRCRLINPLSAASPTEQVARFVADTLVE
jgi:hypothetical protein